jgi:hypothetical protein
MTKIRFFWIASSLLVFFLLSVSARGLAYTAQETPITDRDISMSLVTADGVPVQGSVQGLELKVATITVKSGDSVNQLLVANSIYPDTEAFGFVYDLNPSLAGAGMIKPGQELTLPKVEKRDTQPVLPAGQLVALTMDAGLKTQLVAKFEALDSMIATINRFGVERFADANERVSVLRSLKNINESFAVIVSVTKGKILPVNKELLNQVNSEAELMLDTLEELDRSQRKPSAEDLDLIKIVDDDLTLKTRNLNDVRGPNEPPARPSGVQVVVKTLAQDGRQVPNLRIYYVPLALRNNVQSIVSFDTLSSPTQKSMPEGNYLIWAGKPGQETKEAAVSDVKSLAVRKGADPSLPVDLAVIN